MDGKVRRNIQDPIAGCTSVLITAHLDQHRLQVIFARVHVLLKILVNPLENQPQLGVAVHAVLFAQNSPTRDTNEENAGKPLWCATSSPMERCNAPHTLDTMYVVVLESVAASRIHSPCRRTKLCFLEGCAHPHY